MDDFFDALLGLLGEVGKDIAEAAVIDIIADNGVKICKGIKQVIIGNNGQASTFTELVETKEIGYAGAGAAIFTTEVGVLGAALAPVLGIPLGFILYEAAPEFWTGLSEKLVEGGRTIKNKVIGFFDKDGKTYYDDITINITKDYFIKYGLYNKSLPSEIEGYTIENIWNDKSEKYAFNYSYERYNSFKLQFQVKNPKIHCEFFGFYFNSDFDNLYIWQFPIFKSPLMGHYIKELDGAKFYEFNYNMEYGIDINFEYKSTKSSVYGYSYEGKFKANIDDVYAISFLNTTSDIYLPYVSHFLSMYREISHRFKNGSKLSEFINKIAPRIHKYYINKGYTYWGVSKIKGEYIDRNSWIIQDIEYSNKGTHMSGAPFTIITGYVDKFADNEPIKRYSSMQLLFDEYPIIIDGITCTPSVGGFDFDRHMYNWWMYLKVILEEEYGVSQAMDNAEIPEEDKPINETSPRYIPVPIGGKPMFPVNLKPELEITQEEAQDPDPIDPEDAQDLQDDIEDFEPNPQEDTPQPPPSPNPPSTPDIPDTPELPPIPTPVIPIIPPIPVLPDTPVTTSSSKLFTVYNPTSTILDSVGNFLWSGDLFNELIKVWSNPMNSIISLIAVYCNVSTAQSGFIKFGKFESTIMCPIVSNQFTDIFCGYVDIPEFLHNATDYTPYTQIHVYLPYIGYVEVDPNDFINGKMRIDYRVDVYTGTCLATISAKRVRDMPEDTPLYQFSGNCSQQIPLTGESASGFLSMLSQIVGMGAISATGGNVTASRVAGTTSQSLSHEMVHISHSGGISSNAGILGHEKPMVIITRRNSYEANSYNDFYGYPANIRGTLSNFHGFNKVVSIILTSLSATQEEKNEIVSILTEGVFI